MQATPVSYRKVTIDGGFWGTKVDQAIDVILPRSWEALNDRIPETKKSGCIDNFLIAAGRKKGEHHGYNFQDSDLAKWIEGVAHGLARRPDAKLEKRADWAIQLIGEIQDKSGYLDTCFTIQDRDKRWSNTRDCHELYVAGHHLEAAMAYFETTGKRDYLDTSLKNVEHIAKVFGRKKGQIPSYPGHSELELALVKLYRMSGEKKHLDLAAYFINERGRKPVYYDIEKKKRNGGSHWSDCFKGKYHIVHKPFREQTEPVGHAIRAIYLYCGATDVAKETGDKDLAKVVKTIWRNMTRKYMYVTGSVGSARIGEGFTGEYDLPNETGYGETCAAISTAMWAQRLLALDVDREYGDIMERALYNGVVSCPSEDGNLFFYANRLSSYPKPGG
jgi:DUF1680 family protein